MVSSGKEIQTENGFVQIHPAILDLLAAADLNASEFKCVLFLLRKTYGWGKKEDMLSYGQIAEATGLSRRGVINSMQSLIDKHVVTAKDTKIGRSGCRTYGFNKYFEQWSGVINSEETFTISGDNNSEQSCTITPVNSEETFTIKPEMVNNPSLEMVNNPAPTIDKKESSTLLLPASTADVTVKQFIASVKRYWALLPDSDYTANKLVDWTKRVPLEAWDYALEECVNRAKVGQWGYLDSILRRVEREGVQTKRTGSAPIAAPIVDIAKPEVKAWQI